MRISDWSSDVCSSDLPCRWWLLPGNHDYARNGGLWDRVRHKASDNIILLTEPVAQEMEAGLWLLPAPLLHRHHLDDPTELFDSMETPGAKLRRSEEHTSELQSLMRISYAVFCLKKNNPHLHIH